MFQNKGGTSDLFAAVVAAQDPELFERLLNSIISAGTREGETRLPDEVAKIKAKKLLEKKDELF